MPYNLNIGGNSMAIAEQEYATASEIQFTAFTSCIGIISRNKKKITGIHLVIKGHDGTLFNKDVIPTIIGILGKKYDQVWVIGKTGLWENPQNGVSQAYAKLIKALNNPQVYQLADGTYGARLDAVGNLELTYTSSVETQIKKLRKDLKTLQGQHSDLERDLHHLRAESQYCKLTIKAVGTDVKYKKVTIDDGKQTNYFDSDTIQSGHSDWAKWTGRSWSTYGTKGKVYFEINDRNKFQYSFHSPYTGENKSKIHDEDLKDKDKYEVFFEEKGNISRDGALGHVIIKVKKKKK